MTRAAEVSEQLLTLRKAAGLTQAQVAARAGLTRVSVVFLESGRLKATKADTRHQLSRAFGVPFAAFDSYLRRELPLGDVIALRARNPETIPPALYLACSQRWKGAAEAWAEALRAANFRVASSWHGDPEPTDDRALDAVGRRVVVRRILADLTKADCLVVLAHLGEPRATFVEAGIALEKKKPVVWVHRGGHGRQVFDAHPKTVCLDILSNEPAVRVGILCDAVREALTT